MREELFRRRTGSNSSCLPLRTLPNMPKDNASLKKEKNGSAPLPIILPLLSGPLLPTSSETFLTRAGLNLQDGLLSRKKEWDGQKMCTKMTWKIFCASIMTALIGKNLLKLSTACAGMTVNTDGC